MAENGKSEYKIMYPDEKSASYLYSQKMIAQELRDEIEKLTGAKLEVITDASSETKNLILIGPTKLSPQPSSNFADPEIDFFEIRFSNGNLAIVGNRRGISSGIYELLEKFGGVRYYASWMYVYPKPGILKVLKM